MMEMSAMAGTPGRPGSNCPACNAHSPPGAEKCGRCGTAIMDLRRDKELSPEASIPQTALNRPAFSAPPALGPSRADPTKGWQAPPPVRKSSVSILAGVFIVIGGIISSVVGLLYLMVSSMISQIGVGFGVATTVGVCGAIELAFGMLAIVGGIFAFMRKKFALAIVGAIFCMLSVGFIYSSLVLGMIGLILLVISRSDFD